MVTPLENLFLGMIYERLEDIGSNIVIKDEEYKTRTQEVTTLTNKIKEFLPEEHHNLILTLEEARTRQEGICEFLTYEQGLKDGMRLKGMLMAAEQP